MMKSMILMKMIQKMMTSLIILERLVMYHTISKKYLVMTEQGIFIQCVFLNIFILFLCKLYFSFISYCIILLILDNFTCYCLIFIHTYLHILTLFVYTTVIYIYLCYLYILMLFIYTFFYLYTYVTLFYSQKISNSLSLLWLQQFY